METQVKRLALVVEDTTGDAHMILDALGRDAPAYEVILKNDGLEALDYLFAGDPMQAETVISCPA